MVSERIMKHSPGESSKTLRSRLRRVPKALRASFRLILPILLLIRAAAYPDQICTQDLNANGAIEPETEKWACHSTNPALCPRDMTACNISGYQASGSAAVPATNISGKSGFSRIAAASGISGIDFSGWTCTEISCGENYAGRLLFAPGSMSGSVKADKIARVSGNGEKLDIYGCSGPDCTPSLLGSITLSGAAFSGSAESAGGLHGVAISGDTNLVFTDREGSSAGTVALSGSIVSCPYGSRYSCVRHEGTYKCSPLLCFDETAGGRFGSGQKVCSRDLNGDGTIDFTSEIAVCTAASGGYFCPLGAVNCGTGAMTPICPTSGSDCAGGTFNAALKRCETAQIVVGYRCPTSGNTYADQPSCAAACMQTASCTPGTYSIGVTANESSSYWFNQGIYRTYCSGNQWIMLANACAVAGGNNRSFTISGTTCSGDAGGGNGSVVSALVPSGNLLYVYGCTNPYIDEFGCVIDWRTCGVLFGVLAFNNTVISGEAGRGWNQKCVLNDASGTAFHDSCDWASWTGLGFSGASYESCPLGSYPCTGGACTAGTACTAVNGCPAGYQMVGNICISQPAGGAPVELDPASHVCKAASVNSCPGTGFGYHDPSDLCVKNADCAGGLLDAGLDLCIFTLSDNQCPAGFTYNAVYAACLRDAVCPGGSNLNSLRDACEITSSSSCPDGFTLDAGADKCLAAPSCGIGIYDAAGRKCIVAAFSLTPDGYVFNPSLDRFELAPPCPAGSFYSTSADQCTVEAATACTPPGIYNVGLDICETEGVPACMDPGMTYDGDNSICHAPSICPGAGGTLNTASDLCEGPVAPSCPGSYVWEPARSICETPPSCSTGSYNSSRNRCESVPAGINCPAGYAWDASAGNCRITPSCSSGSYNAAEDRCEQPGTEIYTCPRTGSTYGISETCNLNCTQTGTCAQTQYISGTHYQTCSYYQYTCAYVTTCDCDPGGSYWGCTLPLEYVLYNDSVPPAPGAIPYSVLIGRNMYPDPGCNIWLVYDYSIYWTCSLTGGTRYGSAAACSSACIQSAACAGPSYSCPAGWSLSGSICYQAAFCPGGGFLNGTTDLCEANAAISCSEGSYDFANGACYHSATCPDGGLPNETADLCRTGAIGACPDDYMLNSGKGVCEASPVCPSGLYRTVRNRCEEDPAMTCPADGYYAWDAGRNICEADALAECTLEGFYYSDVLDLCTKTVACPEGGILSGLSDICVVQMNSSKCPAGFTYDSDTGNCWKAPCSSGTYNSALDQCEDFIVGYCPTGFTYNSSAAMCQANPVCDDAGSYDAGIDKCSVPGSSLCPDLYAFDFLEGRCRKIPSCDEGSSYSAALNLCTEPPARECPAEYSYDALSRRCTAAPICYAGNFDQASNMCIGTSSACPLGDRYECFANPATGIMQCSPGECFDMAYMPTERTVPDMKAYTNDGIVDNSTGQCRNSIFIFSGKPRECKTAGMSTSFFNCCDAELGSFGPIQERCGDEDAGTVMGVRGGRCHYVGDYCREKWPLIGCVQRANMYCCFNSKLGRIIQEQGRAQLKTFAGWGGAENPDCRGLTPDEFQMLDFSGIDLSEYFGDVVTKSQAGIQQDMKQKVEDFYRKAAP